MKILHLNAGNETGGGMHHILNLLKQFNRDEFVLGVLEKGELLHRANKVGIQTVYFSNKTKMSIPLIHKIINYIKRENIRFVHTHGPRANVYANVLKKMVAFNWIVTVHSDPVQDFMGKGVYGHFLGKLNLNAIKNADRIIAICEPLRRHLTQMGVHGEKVIKALNGIDFQEIVKEPYSKRDFGLAKEDFLFLMVARLELIKGHEIAFRAFSEIVKRQKNCHLMLLGDGTLRETLKNLAEELGVCNKVHFLGHREDVDLFYKMADITMLTSLSEGFPLVLLESARTKTPVITTNVGGVGELIANESLGWIIEADNVDDLIKAMDESLISHENGELHLIGDRLYSHASTKFSLEIFAENIYNVYLDMKDAK